MKISLILAMTALLVNSCVVYSPQTVDIPLIHEKNDVRLDAGLTLLPPSFNATLSYGLSDKLAAQFYGSIVPEQTYHLQGAVGRYQNISNNQVIELFAGPGFGHGHTPVNSTGGSIDNNYTLGFAQFNYGTLKTQKGNAELGVGIKTGYLYSRITEAAIEDVDRFRARSILLEPTVFARTRGKHVRVSFKLSGCLIANLTNEDTYFPFSKVNFGIALNIR